MSGAGLLPPPYDPTDPNSRYNTDAEIIRLTSATEVNRFSNWYNHERNYSGLCLGQKIYIADGTYDKYWIISGFDMEYQQSAADGTIYDNGYGICLIPETYLITDQWNTGNILTGGYINSNMHRNVLPTVANNLKAILGNHLIERNVLLSNGFTSSGGPNGSGQATGYQWTTAYCTLLSAGQLTGTFAKHNNKYDDGEANYKLPLFNFMSNYCTNIINSFSLRSIYGGSNNYNIWKAGVTSIGPDNVYSKFAVRPLIYIR